MKRPPTRRARRLLVLSGLLSACTTGAVALERGDGGGMCTTSALPWRVTASGAVEYDSLTDVPTGTYGTLASVGSASFVVTTGAGDVTVELSPAPPAGALGTLQVGAEVSVVLEHGVVVDEYANVLVALVGATTTDGSAASLALPRLAPTFRIDPELPRCTRLVPPTTDRACFDATTESSARVSNADASVSISPGDPATSMHMGLALAEYDVTLVACDHPATDAEAMSVAPSGASRCTSPAPARTVALVSARAVGGTPPRCVGDDVRAIGAAGDLVVRASGALTYDFQSHIPSVMDASGQLVSIDTATSSLVVATSTGNVTVAVAPVPTRWLEALPIGHEVNAHFEEGIVLTDAASGDLLLAVGAASAYGPPERDVGPVHVASTAVRCVQVRPASTVCPQGSVNISGLLDARFTMGAAFVDARAGAAPAMLADGTHGFEVALIGSTTQLDGSSTAFQFSTCEGAVESRVFFAIGLAAP